MDFDKNEQNTPVNIINNWFDMEGMTINLIVTKLVPRTCVVFLQKNGNQPIIFAPSREVADKDIEFVAEQIKRHLSL